MKLVKVEWVDAFTPQMTWLNKGDIPDEVPYECLVDSVGYLVKETKEGIWLASGLSGDEKVCNVFFIPHGPDVKITYLEDK